MIDRASRDKLAEALRQYVSGRITNDTLDSIEINKKDYGAIAVKDATWYLYDDVHEHKAINKFYINQKDRKDIARWIVFLQSNEEYIWPKMGIKDMLFVMLTFGLYKKVINSRLNKVGDLSVWPFRSKNELKKASSKPKLLIGKAYNTSDELIKISIKHQGKNKSL